MGMGKIAKRAAIAGLELTLRELTARYSVRPTPALFTYILSIRLELSDIRSTP